MDKPNIALGTKVFSRVERLERLLDSVEDHPIETVVVADDGKASEKKKEVYTAEWDFELKVIDLEFDSGVGLSRQAIVDNLPEVEYSFVVDSDHELPPNAIDLIDILKNDTSLGGVAGEILEPNTGSVGDGCRDFREVGDDLIFHTPEKDIEMIGGSPIVRFDFIPYAAAYRTVALKDYTRDPAYIIGWEHGDFFVGHWKQTDWEFAITPDVMIRHYPGGDQFYANNRNSDDKMGASYEHFLNKWGYNDVIYEGVGWLGVKENTHLLPTPVRRKFRRIKNLFRS
jgi:hypothetical protein